ncbi:hypothetical protein [Parasitella parasitica]|uniref:Uncharacterized protein n=1 Tax=Parasitella parasitica TaxID=35722 RepID=A0A0B7ND50_9FUNG|nr:hypothetical protein [Parasitella parasitica]
MYLDDICILERSKGKLKNSAGTQVSTKLGILDQPWEKQADSQQGPRVLGRQNRNTLDADLLLAPAQEGLGSSVTDQPSLMGQTVHLVNNIKIGNLMMGEPLAITTMQLYLLESDASGAFFSNLNSFPESNYSVLNELKTQLRLPDVAKRTALASLHLNLLGIV